MNPKKKFMSVFFSYVWQHLLPIELRRDLSGIFWAKFGTKGQRRTVPLNKGPNYTGSNLTGVSHTSILK